MKFSEAIAILESVKTAQFEATRFDGKRVVLSYEEGYFMIDIYTSSGERIDYWRTIGAFNGNVRTDLDWQPVRQPVTWQEAIQAGADNKRVWCEFNNQSWSVPELFTHHLYLKKALDVGKWYVED